MTIEFKLILTDANKHMNCKLRLYKSGQIYQVECDPPWQRLNKNFELFDFASGYLMLLSICDYTRFRLLEAQAKGKRV